MFTFPSPGFGSLVLLTVLIQILSVWSQESPPPSNVEPDLCPYNERRLPRELYSKLFVVHFTVIGSYAHLAHLRNESKGLFHYICIVLFPFAGVTMVILQLLALGIQSILYHRDSHTFWMSFVILFGRLPSNDTEGTPLSELSILPRRSPLKVVLRQLTVAIALFIQCVTSIILFVRRVQHGSVALYDHRILQLAVLGLSVAIMSVFQALLQPQHPLLDRNFHRDGPQNKFKRLWWLRPVIPSDSTKQRLLPDEIVPDEMFLVKSYLYFSDFIHVIVATIAARALNSDFYPLAPQCAVFVPMLKDIVANTGLSILCWWYVGLNALLFGLSFLYAPLASRPIRSVLHGIAHRLYLVAVYTPMGCLGWLAYMWVLCALVDFVLYKPVYGLWHFWLLFGDESKNADLDATQNCEIGPDWRHIAAFGMAPTFCPCPKAWKDDMADYVWWLA